MEALKIQNVLAFIKYLSLCTKKYTFLEPIISEISNDTKKQVFRIIDAAFRQREKSAAQDQMLKAMSKAFAKYSY